MPVRGAGGADHNRTPCPVQAPTKEEAIQFIVTLDQSQQADTASDRSGLAWLGPGNGSKIDPSDCGKKGRTET